MNQPGGPGALNPALRPGAQGLPQTGGKPLNQIGTTGRGPQGAAMNPNLRGPQGLRNQGINPNAGMPRIGNQGNRRQVQPR
ncbi:hypothetical protein ABTF07_19905, partial [Acinetobacter baumannii]